MLLGVDVGGTFTDAVLAAGGRLVTAKVPTTPGDQSEGVIAAVTAALERAGARPQDVCAFSHGMTVATNALLEGRGARTAFVATEGFSDIVALGRQDRPELYRLGVARPQPLTAPEARFGAPERMGPDGPLRELSPRSAAELAQAVAATGPEAVAVALLHSYRHPEHELAVGAALAKTLPGVHVSLSHEVVGTFREYERAATTEVDAALSPLLAGYLRRLSARCAQAGVPEPSIMQSNGGLIELPTAAGHAAWTVLSGPAGGAAAAAYVARAAGTPDALCFDMGGTSCDVCVVDGGAVQEQSSGTIARRPLALPMVAVHTVGAGGGSIAWRDPGGALRVGPRSAGADPGPACYGRGGTEPTVTDANLVLGFLSAQAPLAGGVTLDLAAARNAIARLAGELALEPGACAEGIIRVANAEMLRALRVVTVQRGVDPRRYALLAFGGAGPLHAAAIASELGIGEIVCPRASGVLAALGLVVSSRRRDVQRSVLLRGDALTAAAVAALVAELGGQARAELRDAGAELRAVYELRYRGQAFELAVQCGLSPEPDELRRAFESLHEERYGYHDHEQELELVTLRVSATVPGAEVSLGEAGTGGEPTTHRRRAMLGGAEIELEVLRGLPAPGTAFDGPTVVELPESTLLAPPGWSGTVDEHGTIHLRAAWNRPGGDSIGESPRGRVESADAESAESADAESDGESPRGDSPDRPVESPRGRFS
ncbi:MAG: hydantoinase/oxoprolinase family protein [Solirubrobacteraceae bacterium]